MPSPSALPDRQTLAIESGNKNFLEACYHLLTPHNASLPGTVLSTGTEDYFDSAYYFDGGTFRFPEAGNTFGPSGTPTRWSGYRFHDNDPLVFHGGVRLLWRIGDYINPETHPESPKCFIDAPGAGDKPVGTPLNTTVTSYVWVYTW